MKEYFILSLNNNKCACKDMLENVIYKGIYYDLPVVFEESKSYEAYDPIEVLAVKSAYGFRDLLTGEVIVESRDGDIDTISYYKSCLATTEDIIRITNKYKMMSEDDKARYRLRLDEIKSRSVELFNEKERIRRNMIIEESLARNYLLQFQDYDI